MTHYVALMDGEAGGYGVTFPDAPGCSAMGGTAEAALRHAGDALRDWIESSEAHGEAVPTPRPLEALRADAEVLEALAEGASLVTVPLIRATGRPVKANLSLDSGVLDAIDAAATKRKITRSAFVELMARHALPDLAG